MDRGQQTNESDESKFETMDVASSARLQRLVISAQFKSLMAWGCVSADGRGSMQIWRVTTSAESIYRFYGKIRTLPSGRRLLQVRPCIFQQENTKKPHCSMASEWKSLGAEVARLKSRAFTK